MPNEDISSLSYEAARDQLGEVVRTLESGNASLEDSLKLWERGEALAAHCQAWLDGARRRLDAATRGPGAGAAETPAAQAPTGGNVAAAPVVGSPDDLDALEEAEDPAALEDATDTQGER